jgi:hypothetical protein
MRDRLPGHTGSPDFFEAGSRSRPGDELQFYMLTDDASLFGFERIGSKSAVPFDSLRHHPSGVGSFFHGGSQRRIAHLRFSKIRFHTPNYRLQANTDSHDC